MVAGSGNDTMHGGSSADAHDTLVGGAGADAIGVSRAITHSSVAAA